MGQQDAEGNIRKDRERMNAYQRLLPSNTKPKKHAQNAARQTRDLPAKLTSQQVHLRTAFHTAGGRHTSNRHPCCSNDTQTPPSHPSHHDQQPPAHPAAHSSAADASPENARHSGRYYISALPFDRWLSRPADPARASDSRC